LWIPGFLPPNFASMISRLQISAQLQLHNNGVVSWCGKAMDKLSYLPRIEKERLEIWDKKREACCGYLNKRAGKGSTFSQGKWQKRWFVLKIQISGHENYTLSYYHSPEDKSPRQSFILDDATVTLGGGGNLLHSFQLICSDGLNVMLGCDSDPQMHAWIATLNYAIQIATERGKIQRDRWGSTPTEKTRNYTRHQAEGQPSSNHSSQPLSPNRQHDSSHGLENSIGPTGDTTSPFYYSSSQQYLSVRLDLDITTIPPGSTQRNQFEDMFCGDICRTLNIQSNMIQIHSLSPTPGMDWLTLVTFDLYLTEEFLGFSDYEIEQIENDSTQQEEVNELFRQKKQELISELLEALQNSSSILYNGFVTCNIDPSYTSGLITSSEFSDSARNSSGAEAYEVYSSSSEILAIMERYHSIHLPSDSIDLSHFKIYLSFENKIKSLFVPNPLILRAKYCVVWPYEVKKAIGMMGNMQEMWIEPIALVPKGLPKHLSEPIYFQQSLRLASVDGRSEDEEGGVMNRPYVISAHLLKADLCYDVVCEDNRSEILKILTEEERESIKTIFEQYDHDGNGYISRTELETMIKNRIKDRKELIDEKFQEIIRENPRGNYRGAATSDENYLKAEEFRRMHYQQLQETQNKLLKMFEAADIDRDGMISYHEFLLAEAWWLRCTLNPEHATLF
jgi:Ca2+-binding EF-hand superfamily protein